MALVQHHGPRPARAQPLDQLPPVGMQQVQRRPAGPGRGVLARFQGADGLVGEDGQRGRQLPAHRGRRGVRGRGAGRLERRLPLSHPLGLDGRVRGQHDGGPPDPPHRLQPDQRLPAAGRHDHVGGGGAAGPGAARPRALDCLQRPGLVRPQLADQPEVAEHAGGRTGGGGVFHVCLPSGFPASHPGRPGSRPGQPPRPPGPAASTSAPGRPAPSPGRPAPRLPGATGRGRR
jgi:hypothetical protein